MRAIVAKTGAAMRNILFILLALFSVSACAGARETVARANDDVRYEAGESYKKVRGYLAWKRAPQPIVEQYNPERYCYKLQSDIVCYNEPVAGADNTLVGYQEPVMTKTLVPAKAVGAKEDYQMPILPRHVWTEKTNSFPYVTVYASNEPRGSGRASMSGGGSMGMDSGSFSSNRAPEPPSAPVFVGAAPKVKGVDDASAARESAAPKKSKPGTASSSSSATETPKTASPAKPEPVVSSSAYTPKDLIPSF